MSTRFLVPLGTALLAVAMLQIAYAQAPAEPPDHLKEVPASSWVYGAATHLRNILYPSRQHGDNPAPLRMMTRYEFAVMTARIVESLPTTQKANEQHMTASIAWTRKDLDVLQRLTEEFSKELKALGVALASYYQRIDALRGIAPPFSDVPAGHWAAPSVEIVRKAGIIVGYPSGRFNENAPSG